MEIFWSWITKNLSHFFSVLGIALTLYIGFFYVPDWQQDDQEVRYLAARENLEQSIKELIYTESITTLEEIRPLIKAKELEIGYSFNEEEVLIEVQESFMEDRFLSLTQRRKLFKEIENLKDNLYDYSGSPEIIATAFTVRKDSWRWLWASLSVLLVAIGIWGFYSSSRVGRAKDEEIENQILQADSSKTATETAFEYEALVEEDIVLVHGVQHKRFHEYGDLFELEFVYEGELHYVEIKYLSRSKVGLKSIENFISKTNGKEGRFWFIHNSSLTEMAKRRTREAKKLETPKKSFLFFEAEDLTDFKERFEERLKQIG